MRLLRQARRAVPPGDVRLLLWVLGLFLIGTGCCAASMILAFTWAAVGGRGEWLTAAHWLTRCAYALLAVIVVLGVILVRRRAADGKR